MKRIFLLVVMLGALASASHLSQLMQRYKHAAESQRYRIMNQIKLEIARLNKRHQRSAIRALRSISRGSSHTRRHPSKHSSSRTHDHAHQAHTTVRQGVNHISHTVRSHHPSAQDMLNGHSFGFGGGTHSGGHFSGSSSSSPTGSGSSSSSAGSSGGSGDSGSSGGHSGDSGGFSMPGGGSMPGGMGGF